MLKINNAIMQFDFVFEHINGKTMKVSAWNDNKCWPVQLLEKEANYYGFLAVPVALPGQVRLEFSGKNQNTDTLIDAKGNIIKDICVKIKSIRLDGLIVDPGYLNEHIQLKMQEQSLSTGPYIGFNGSIIIELAKDNVFSQLIEFARLARTTKEQT